MGWRSARSPSWWVRGITLCLSELGPAWVSLGWLGCLRGGEARRDAEARTTEVVQPPRSWCFLLTMGLFLTPGG